MRKIKNGSPKYTLFLIDRGVGRNFWMRSTKYYLKKESQTKKIKHKHIT